MIFSTGAVRKYLQSGGAPPKPRRVADVIAAPLVDSLDFYPPTIFGLQWLRDSNGIVFTAEGLRGNRRLYRVDLAGGSPRAISPPDYDVTEFGEARGAIVYEATPPFVAGPLGHRVNADA